MAKNQRLMPVLPEAVWAVLARPESYGYWVVGSKVIRDADAAFPAVGTKLHHTLEPRDGGTHVCIVEDPDQLYTPLKYNPLLQLATRVRNAETLARLEELALQERKASV